MMQVRSGLTGIQVKQKKYVQRHTAGVLAPAFQLRPVLLLGAGFGILSDAWLDSAWFGLALAALITLACAGVHAAFTRWLAQFNAPQPVLVVRDGLLRAVPAQALVAGDLIQVPAGSLLPVDVVTNAPAVATGWLRLVLALSGRQMPTGVALAGSRMLTAARVEVLAIADNRFIAADAQTLFASPMAGRQTLRHLGAWLLTLGATLAKQAHTRLLLHRTQLQLTAVPTLAPARSWQPLLQAAMTRRPLVDPMRHSAKEVAFRYNQDPVSWRLA